MKSEAPGGEGLQSCHKSRLLYQSAKDRPEVRRLRKAQPGGPSGAGPVVEAGKREGPEQSTNPSSVPYQEVLGGGQRSKVDTEAR